MSIVESCGRGAEVLAEACMEGFMTNWMGLVRTTAGWLCYTWGTEVGRNKRTVYIAPEATVEVLVRPGGLSHIKYQEDGREQRVRLAEQLASLWGEDGDHPLLGDINSQLTTLVVAFNGALPPDMQRMRVPEE